MAVIEYATFMGIPIDGEPMFPRRHQGEQWTAEQLSEYLKPLLASDHIEAIRWTQYTPYFNDGDVCEFSIGETYWKMVGDEFPDDDGEWEDGFLDSWDHRIKGGRESRYVAPGPGWGMGSWEDFGPTLPQVPDYDAMREFESNLYHFESVLYDLFGDHATVTVHKDRITVETYEHE